MKALLGVILLTSVAPVSAGEPAELSAQTRVAEPASEKEGAQAAAGSAAVTTVAQSSSPEPAPVTTVAQGSSSGSAPAAAQTAVGEPPAVTTGPRSPSSQALPTLDKFTGRNALGAMVGLGSGIGLSYRRYLSDRFALRAAGYVFYIKDTIDYHNLALAGQFDFRRDQKFVIYGLAGLGYGHAEPFLEAFDGAIEAALYPNLGVGLELGPHDRPALTYQIELVLTALLVDDSDFRMLPLPQFGIHYVF